MLRWWWLYERYSLMVFFKKHFKDWILTVICYPILDCGLTLPNYFLTKNLFGQLKTFPHNFDPTIFITIGFVHIVISLVIPFLEQEQNLFGHESFWQNFFHKIFVEQKFFSTENILNQIFNNQTINLMGFDTFGINLVD